MTIETNQSFFKGKIYSTVRNEAELFRKSKAWLQSAEKFSHNYLLSKRKKEIAFKLFDNLIQQKRIYNLQDKQQDFEIICANLIYNRRRNPIAISCNRNDWTKCRYRRASYWVVEDALPLLKENGLIEIEKGYGSKIPGQAKQTKIWPTDEFLELFNRIEVCDSIYVPIELVRLKDRKNKTVINYTDTKKTIYIRYVGAGPQRLDNLMGVDKL